MSVCVELKKRSEGEDVNQSLLNDTIETRDTKTMMIILMIIVIITVIVITIANKKSLGHMLFPVR